MHIEHRAPPTGAPPLPCDFMRRILDVARLTHGRHARLVELAALSSCPVVNMARAPIELANLKAGVVMVPNVRGHWAEVALDRFGVEAFEEAAEGRTEWPTIREAFWRGRLRMPLRNDKVPEDQMEFLHGVLSHIARRYASSGERSADMFHGSGQFCDWYFAWLHNQGLIDEFKGHLTAEGWAVLHMLMATRPQPVRQDRPGRATVRQLTEVGLGPEEREARLGRVERMASDWGEGFRRKRIGAWPHVILVERGEGPVPVLQTTWSLRFDTDEQRDDFYEWLCVRLDRWPAWAELADGHPHLELTQHLLMVMTAALAGDAQPQRGSASLQGYDPDSN